MHLQPSICNYVHYLFFFNLFFIKDVFSPEGARPFVMAQVYYNLIEKFNNLEMGYKLDSRFCNIILYKIYRWEILYLFANEIRA